MTVDEVKVWTINSVTLSVTTFGHIEDWLKLILLLVTIGYTAAKWRKIYKEHSENGKDK